ncbi:MAG: glutamine amidotransferase-related protein [Paracoccaceae bacterium]
MLGICQGAQQIAHHLGAKVGPVDNSIGEFGYYQINPTKDANDFLKSSLHVAQAHYHTFDIPKDAVKLAGSELFSNQAFKVQQNVYGLQFHAEVTIEGFRRWQNSDWPSRLGHQTIEEQTRLMHKHDAAQASWFYDFLNNLFL